MEYLISGNDIVITAKDFNLAQTLDCGQAFRWSEYPDGWKGWFLNKFLHIVQHGDTIIFKNTSEKSFLKTWVNYFDLLTDYSILKKNFSSDPTLKKACDFAGGIRLLKQDPWECLISFIISQNNNIPRIKGIISRLCEHYGCFPSAETLAAETENSLSFLRAGFRTKYILDASKRVANGSCNLKDISAMPIDDARKKLMEIKGVGAKVSECVLLFGMHKTQAFPIDVWIKRVLEEYYPEGFPEFAKENCGIAQQYLFHYIRNRNSLS